MTYFEKIDPINDIFDQIYVHKPDWNNFLDIFRENMVWILSQNFDIWGHFGPKNDPILPCSPKMTYFDQIDPINDIFDQVYIHKSDWTNF